MFTEHLSGLGLTVVVTPRKSPAEMAAREQYWFNTYLNQLVNDMADQYRQAGFEGLGAVPTFIPLNKIPLVGGVVGMFTKIPVIGKLFCVFGGCDKPKIPWGEIYAEVTPVARQYAHQTTIDEENARQEAEKAQVQETRQAEGTKRSEAASRFEMPTGVTSISQGGALVISPVGPAIIRKK